MDRFGWKVRHASLAAVVLATLGLAACEEQRPAPPGSTRVNLLIVGLDGASWQLIDPLLAQGELPNLARLIDEGVRAPLETLDPSLSPAVWTTLATGKPPEVHGITNFHLKGPDGPSMASSSMRRAQALWTILPRGGRDVGFVGWWVTWPAEPVEGYMVSEQFLRPNHEGLERATFPEELTEELDAAIPAEWPWLRRVLDSGELKLIQDLNPNANLSQDERWEQGIFYYGQDHRAERAMLHLLGTRARPALTAVTLRKIDIATHLMPGFLPEDQQDAASLSALLASVYRHEDDLLGRLIEAAGPARNVLVISDHGFELTEKGWDHKESAPDGIFVARGPAFEAGVALDPVSVFDVAPTILHVLGFPVADDMPGEVRIDALRDPRPVKRVATYETGDYGPGAGERSPLEDDIRRELQALGYIK